MKLKTKVILFFSATFLVVLGIAMIAVYISMSQYRVDEFAQRLKEKTTGTFRLLIEFKDIDHDLLSTLNETTINNLSDEVIIIFDESGRTIYSSQDDIPVRFPESILNRLKNGEDEISYIDNDYDAFAHIIQANGKTYYAIGKAKDLYGKEKLSFLKWTLISVYLIALAIQIIIAIYLSDQITKPITKLTNEVSTLDINNLTNVSTPQSSDEIAKLSDGFNKMLLRVEQAYSYQKNLIQHISHELKTPIAVLISNLERSEVEENLFDKNQIEFQKSGLMQMAAIISTLLDISKFETNQQSLAAVALRLDELVFECFETLKLLKSEAKFELLIDETITDVEQLSVNGNERMLRIAFNNLLNNAIEYSQDQKVIVKIVRSGNLLTIGIKNNGPLISMKDREKLFTYFFRGENSSGRSGLGLGLVMVSKIINLHKGSIKYNSDDERFNTFELTLSAS